MNNRIKALAILPVATALTFFGLQAMTSSFAETSSGSEETTATTGATAVTIEDCDWYLTGVSDTIALIAEDEMEYVGDDYTLSADDGDIDVYFSGTETIDERCSFYDDVMGAAVEVSWTTAAFTALTDPSLDWDLGDALEDGGVSSLDVTYTPSVESCDAAFVAGASVSITDLAVSPLAPATITNSSTAGFSPSELTGATFAKCSLAANYSVVLPGGRTPTSPGESYEFTGPQLITTIVVNDPEE